MNQDIDGVIELLASLQTYIIKHPRNIMSNAYTMADILAFKKNKLSRKHKGKTLCRSGFHKWEIVEEKQFEVTQGRLVTVYRCKRCGKQKNTAI